MVEETKAETREKVLSLHGRFRSNKTAVGGGKKPGPKKKKIQDEVKDTHGPSHNSTHLENPLINNHGGEGEEMSRSVTDERRAASDFFSLICIMRPLFLKLMFLLLPELNKWPLKN